MLDQSLQFRSKTRHIRTFTPLREQNDMHTGTKLQIFLELGPLMAPRESSLAILTPTAAYGHCWHVRRADRVSARERGESTRKIVDGIRSADETGVGGDTRVWG